VLEGEGDVFSKKKKQKSTCCPSSLIYLNVFSKIFVRKM
jgi:hypothetical protein